MRNAAHLVLILLICFAPACAQTRPEVNSPPEEKAVAFSFRECAGKFSVFLLENHLAAPIFARVGRVDFWKEYKAANMELGVHYVERVPPIPKPKVISIGPWDAPPPFREIASGESVRYAIQIPADKADYRVRVPYMENGEVVRRFEGDFDNLVKNDMPLLVASWKDVFSQTEPNRCR